MVRNRVRKTTIGQYSAENMQEAVKLVEKGSSLRKAAKQKQINYMTLSRYVKKIKNKTEEERENIKFTPNYANRTVFSKDQERELREYIITYSKLNYGLDAVECRKFAYEMAVFHRLRIPKSWNEKKMAGIDWFNSFKQRNADLMLQKSESYKQTKATFFDRQNINIFFDYLQEVYSNNHCFSNGTRVFNLYEIGITMIQESNELTSTGEGILVITCCIVSAMGFVLPPAIVFPVRCYEPLLSKDAPLGTLGLANPDGLMTSELFLEVIKHFIKVTSSTKDNPSLIILDNHESHLAPAVFNIAKDNGITLLTIPPHSRYKLQPLDVSVLDSFHACYNAAAKSWTMRNPEKSITIYDVGDLVSQVFDKIMTPDNIRSGFEKTGIFPFNRTNFSNNHSLCKEATEQQSTSTYSKSSKKTS